jgi:hypothetical protein
MVIPPEILRGCEERFNRFRKLFIAQDLLGDSVNEVLDNYSDKIKIRNDDENDLSMIIGAALGKGLKTFQAVNYLCRFGFGEDALIILRSNTNLLININFILSSKDPNDIAGDFLAYSFEERKKYLKIAHGVEDLPWKPRMSPQEYNRRVKSWKNIPISDKAKDLSDPHYDKCYRFYSSLEHGDAFALHGYIENWDKNGPSIGSGPNDQNIDLALPHNFLVMRDLIQCVCRYFGIDRPDIFSKLNETIDDALKQ